MNNMLKSYQLEIFGELYTLMSDESKQHVVTAANLVDTYMKEIAGKMTTKNVQRLAVLAAVRLASVLLYKEAELEKYHLHEEELVQMIDDKLQTDKSVV